MNWSKSNQMVCIDGSGSSVMEYMMTDIHVYNQIIISNLLNDYEFNYDHRPLTLTLNFVMHKIPIEENSNN
jgi:hypothetical protein